MTTSRRWRLLAAPGVLMLAGVLGIVWLQRAMLFPRPAAPPEPPATPGVERWWIDSSDGPVEAWLVVGDGVDEEHPGPAVVYAHGNGELIDDWPDRLARYRQLGISVLLPEYRGYGRSAGGPSEAAIAEDMEAALERARAHPLVDPARIVYHGRSLGGGAIGTLLDAHPPRALVLESTFTSVPDVASWAPRFLIVDRFESLPRVARYRGPLLLMHGTRDEVVPVTHGRRLAESHPGAELVLYDCGHNDLPPPGADYWARIERFLRGAGVL